MAKKLQRNATPSSVETFPTELILGIKAFAITGLAILIVQLLRGNAQSEGPDKAIYLLSIAIAGAFLLLGLTKANFGSGK